MGACGGTPDTDDGPQGPRLSIRGELLPGPVTVQVAGSDPGKVYELTQCVASADGPTDVESSCDTTRPATRTVTPNADGEAVVEFDLRAVIGVGGRTEFDCIAGSCRLALTDPAGIVTSFPLEWAPDAETTPAPQLTIQRLTFAGQGNRGSATLRGAGFPPGARATVVQCPAAPPEGSSNVDAGDCLYAYGTRVRADGAGAWTRDVLVFRRFQRSNDELIDCDETPELCALAIPWPTSVDYRMARITFDQVGRLLPGLGACDSCD